jgi:DNA-binding NarL/FixJ family response regulator
MNGQNEIMERVGNSTAMPACLLSDRELASTRIWLVDDNAMFRSLLADLLECEVDFHCERQFSSPPEILKALARETAPDIILLDKEMGEHDGLDAIRPIKALAPDAHVLMLTTFAAPGCREQAFREGASDFMLKTWSIPEIASHMRQAMEFGPVAGLMTAFLSGGHPVEEPMGKPMALKPKETKKIVVRTSVAERWFTHLRGLLKLSPS